MKKITLSLLCFLSLFSLSHASESTKLDVDVFLYSENDDFIKKLSNDFNDSFIKQDYNIKTFYSNQDILREQIGVKKSIKQKTSGIIVNAVDPKNVSHLIQFAKNSDKPIVFINRKPSDTDLKSYKKAFYVGTDGFNAGHLQADIVLSYYAKNKAIDKDNDGVINYLLLKGEIDHQDTISRTQALEQHLASGDVKFKNIKTIVANWREDESYNKTFEYISNPVNLDKIEFIISNNDSMALGAINALKAISNNRCCIPVIGVDGTTIGHYLVNTEQMIATVNNNSSAQAIVALEIIKLLNDNKEITKDTIKYNVIDEHSILVPYSKILGF